MSFPKVYTVNGPSSTSSTSLPSWVAVKTKAKGGKKRTKTQHTTSDLELIQDFTFPGSAIRIKTTEDGQHAIATGTYKPMIKVWDLENLTVKFERVTDAENVDFVILSSDWTKTLHLQRDRSLSLHTQGGLHHSVRLPIYGRSLAYYSPSADAIIGCTGTDVYRFSLEEGRYMSPITVARNWGADSRQDEVEGVNVVDVNPRHGLWSFGLDGGGGVIEFWDPRSRNALTRLSLPSTTLLPLQNFDSSLSLIAQPIQKLSITALQSHPTDGLSLAVGTSTGHTLLYDLRSPTPFAIKDQGYGESIRKVDWLVGGGSQEDSGRVISADSKVIKVWDKSDPSNNHLSLHPPSSLVDLHPVPQSGLLMVACDSPQLSSYYIPEIGPAPKWASFLDSVTEEMAEDYSGLGKSAYQDFKFVDRAELDTLGLTHLIGTPALKPYMHGYFLSLKLYTTARLIANPQSYAEYRDKIVNEKLRAKQESRIRARKDQPKVNKALAERIRKAEERDKLLEKKKKQKNGDAAPEDEEAEEGEGEVPGGLLADPRFKEIFENPEFEVDEESREFALLNPATANNNAKRKTAVEEEEDESDRSSSGLEDEDEDESEEEEDEQDEEDQSDSEESDDGDLLQYDPRRLKPTDAKRVLPAIRSQPKLVVGSSSSSSSSRQQPTFGQRLKTSNQSSRNGKGLGEDPSVLAMRKSADGGMEMSFIPSSKPSRSNGPDGEDDEQDEYSGGTRRKDRKVERFGAGMEKGQLDDDDEGQEGEGRSGRTKRRHPGRSASKNAFRKR
ncbi:ribosome biogenesis protein ENP2 [Kwoniella mangroviensis CBS 8886]|nr:ribosome biogenesis protein ENP2 [Kwoniella mangroviensis CBS 8886]